jgi:hypothetical protein
MDAFKPANNDQIVTDCKELDALFPTSKDKLPNVPSYKGNQYRASLSPVLAPSV